MPVIGKHGSFDLNYEDKLKDSPDETPNYNDFR